MIEWHKAKDVLPPCDTAVLVAITAEGYISEEVAVAKLLKTHGYTMWFNDCLPWRYIEDTDYWAYINLPEKDGE